MAGLTRLATPRLSSDLGACPPRNACGSTAAPDCLPWSAPNKAYAATEFPQEDLAPAPYISRRASSARPSVTSSAYSKSPPTGSPDAIRVTFTPSGLMSRAR